jgi:predicted O-methyltransferase YrrM
LSTLFHDDGPKATGQKVMLATTAYDSPDASYTFSIAKSREALTAAGIQSAYVLLSGNCHVDDARNSVVHTFMASDCTDLVFLDADVSWNAEDLITLCQYDLDLVGGVYPYRREDGKEKRGMPYMPMAGATIENGLIEVAGLPTGFMRIRRNVFDTLIPLSPAFNAKNKNMTGIPLLFERVLKGGTRMGGDLNFCLKWMAAGGKLYAATEFVLGHSCKTVLKDSLGAHLRRANNETLPRIVERIRNDEETPEDYTECFEYINNPWGASDELLICAVAAARKADGPIIETGSGLTSVLMAAATAETVYCLEHNPHFANQTRAMAQAAGVFNIAIVHCEINDGWYDLSDEDIDAMPAFFALGLNDGPPRQIGDRMRFFDVFGGQCKMILSDDADDPGYAAKLTTWAEDRNRVIAFPEFRSAIIMEAA